MGFDGASDSLDADKHLMRDKGPDGIDYVFSEFRNVWGATIEVSFQGSENGSFEFRGDVGSAYA